MDKQLKELVNIPWVWPKLAKMFFDTWIKKVSDLNRKNPEDLYNKICINLWYQVDRCVLYVCRSSVYFAENEIHDSEKLKWWNWKDKK